ncbi:ligand-dependent nuclear receptor-interacting factor 1 isoform X3 [Pitangus sulphuratus]|nr:ligand-dependent nuclear receptor-interacting factor 1 isoform X3 [Pitangus sulphuratus]
MQGVDRGCVQDVAVSSSSPQGSPAYMVVSAKPVPVSVKSPVLPSGHHLQIPADAEVKSVPASLLPPAIQRRILAATAGADGSRPPTVIYVSPVNTVRTPQALPKRLLCPPGGAEAPKALLLTAAPERGGSPGPAPPAGRQCRQSPMKWIVQEAAPVSAPCLIPVKSSNNVASRILKTLSDARNAEGSSAGVLPPCPGGAQAKLAPLKDNALVMYNGKVYLLTRRGSDILAAQAERQPPAPPSEAPLRKDRPQRADSSAVNKITSKVVNLVRWEQMDPLGKVTTPPPEQPHWKQYSELRRRFGLSKEERVSLRRIPLTQEFWEEPEGRGCSSLDSKRDSWSSLDVETRNCPQDCAQEEKVVVDLEEDLTRKRKIKSSPLSDSGKRRRNSARSSPSPSSEPSHAPPRSVSPPPASPEPRIPTGSCGASPGRGSEPGTPPACSDSLDSEIPELVTAGGSASLLEGSFRDDAFPAAPPDLDETIRDEKIRRLKQLLREREAALEEMRREMQQS